MLSAAIVIAVSVGAPEIIIVLAIVLLLFGSTQLPKLARSLGQAQKEFKSGLKESNEDKAEDDTGSSA